MTEPRVAIACSGLGHVRRGNETGSKMLAEALHASGVGITLFGGAALDEVACPYEVVTTLRRDSRLLRNWVSWDRRYTLEQYVFEYFLDRRIGRDEFDVVQVGDPVLALRLHKHSSRLGFRVLYQNGQLLGPTWCAKFDFVQIPAPYYREIAEGEGVDTSGWRVIPYPVDSERFHPGTARREERRRLLGSIPEDALVVLAVGDFAPTSNKRLDWLVAEVARVGPAVDVHLVVLGQARSEDVHAFLGRNRKILGDRLHVFSNVHPAGMPEWYRSASVLAHAALKEPYGIAFVEAMASGLPVIAHSFPVTEWIVGEGGRTVDMTREGALAAELEALALDPARRIDLGRAARARVEGSFSLERVLPLFMQTYREIRAA